MLIWIHKGIKNRRASSQEQLDAFLYDGWELGQYIDPVKAAEAKEKKRVAAIRQHQNQTEEQRQEIANKIRNTLVSKSDEEKSSITAARLKTRSQWTEEEKKTNSERLSAGRANRDEEKKRLQLERFKNTLSERSQDKTDSWKKNLSISIKNKFSSMTEQEKSEFSETIKKVYANLPLDIKQARSDKISHNQPLAMIQKYGVSNSMKVPEIRSKIAKASRYTGLEKRMTEFLTNNDFVFQHHYVIKKDNLIHEFDFAVVIDSKLELLIDCDGLYYHGYLDNVNGKSVNNYTDDYRATLIPEGVKFIVCVEREEESAYAEILKLKDVDYNSYIQNVFQWCRSTGFPYPENSSKLIESSYQSLVKSDVDKFTMYARYGEKAVLAAHKSIWSANKEGCLSPIEAWNNDALLTDMIKNRIVYKGSSLHREDMLRAFSVTRKAPRVSVFNPYLAKYLVSKYLSEYQTIFDPCAGFSGRMLGVCSLKKQYIGQDINPTTVREANSLKQELSLDASIRVKDSLNSSGCYEALFTCTPYNSKENWGQDIADMSCDEWIAAFIKNFKCRKYLFVVDRTEQYKDYIVEELTNKSHFGTNSEYVVLV